MFDCLSATVPPQLMPLIGRLRAHPQPPCHLRRQNGEQWTMFLLDPAGNALEFKAFADDSQVFAAS